MHGIFILYISVYMFCCLLEHPIATGYITDIDNKWLLYEVFCNISIIIVIIVFKMLLVNIVCKIYMNIVLILKMFWIVKFICAPKLIAITFPTYCKVNNASCRSFNYGCKQDKDKRF